MSGLERLGQEDSYAARSWLRAGRDPQWIAETLLTSVERVERCRGRGTCGYVPSPSEIARLTAAIRSKWPKQEHAVRRTRGAPAIKEFASATDYSSARLLG